MEPKNDPIEKENHLPNRHYWVPCQFYEVQDLGFDPGASHLT